MHPLRQKRPFEDSYINMSTVCLCQKACSMQPGLAFRSWRDVDVQGCHQGERAPVPPYLHYQDPADEEESCPQPSALPAALAASCLGTGWPQAPSHHRFHSHPPLPPHPLLKLHRPVSNSSTQQGSSPANRPAQQTGTDGICIQGNINLMAKSAVNGQITSANGPGSSSPSGTATENFAAPQPSAAENESSEPLVSQPSNVQSDGHQQAGDCQDQHTGMQQQQQQHWLQRHEMTAASDSSLQCARCIVPSCSSTHERTGAEQQDQSDTGSEQSEPCECKSVGAVGDDELLDHEPDMAMEAHAAQSANPASSWHDTWHSSEPFGGKTSTACATQPVVWADRLSPDDKPSARAAPLHQEGSLAAMPHYTVSHGVGQHPEAVRHLHQWVQQAVTPAFVGPCGAQHLQRGRQEHRSREPSKLRAAYRGHCHPAAQQPQHEELQQQNKLQHAQHHHPGADIQSSCLVKPYCIKPELNVVAANCIH